MAAIIIVGMTAASSPKMFTTIGMPRMTKLLRKMACVIVPRFGLSFSNHRENATDARNSAVTDSESEVAFREGKPGVCNLMTIYSAVTHKSMDDITKEFAGKGYGDFKKAVGEAVAEELRPVRENFDRLMNDRAYLDEQMKKGAERATYIANKTLTKAKKRVGLLLEN